MKKILLLALSIINYATAHCQNVGIGTTSPKARLHVADSSVFFTAGSINRNTPLAITEEGNRMMWVAPKAAFRVGGAEESEWTNEKIGIYSFASGYKNVASGDFSFAGGWGTSAMGYSSAAYGKYTNARGPYSFVAGHSNDADGEYSTVFGVVNSAIGLASTTLGGQSIAQGSYSTVAGYNAFANGFASFTVGMYNDSIVTRQTATSATSPLFIVGNGSTVNSRSNAMVVLKNGNTGMGTNSPQARLHVADSSVLFSGGINLPATPGAPPLSGSGIRCMWYADKAAFRAGFAQTDQWDKENIGNYSFAAGQNPTAKGIGSVALGAHSVAEGFQAVAIGTSNSKALGNYSSAIGFYNTANGYYSTALGMNTTTNGAYSMTLGGYTESRSWYALAAGYNTVAKGYASFVTGMYNAVSDASDLDPTEQTPLFMIGNGNDNADRKNAMVVLKNGNVSIGNNNNPVNRLHITGGTNLSLADNSGYMTLGATNSGNMVFDNNEIQVRNNGVGTNLYLQSNGGKVIIGSGGASAHLFTVNGSAYKNDGSNVWQTTSDARLKKDIEPYNDGLFALLKIQPVWFQYNEQSGFDTQQRKVGILAQELQKVAPYMVSETSAIKAPDGSNYLSVDNGAMTYMLINAVKEQQQQIEELKKVNATLINRLEKLEAK